MRILGLSAFYHDSAAALVCDGEVVAAAQEERFTRKRHDESFPSGAVRFCLDAAGLGGSDIDRVVFYEKPFLKFERLVETYLAVAPRGFRSFQMAMPIWLRTKLFHRDLISAALREIDPALPAGRDLLFCEHHMSHAASAFYPSPFERAAVLCVDGVGERATTSLAIGRGADLSILKEIHFPHSLGLFYSAFTQYCGFKVNSGEYKLMGLAPYGEPRFRDLILDHLIGIAEDGSFRLNIRHFGYVSGLSMINRSFERLFGGPARRPDEEIEQRHMDIAASAQAVLDEVMLRLTRSIARESGEANLCLAGGVTLNCVSNGRILEDGAFEQLFVQPAAGDAGGALGAALAVHHQALRAPREVHRRDGMKGAFLGPGFTPDDAAARLTEAGARFRACGDGEVLDLTAAALAEGKVVGWFQGRMEFGPRALGARSILADPRAPAMQRQLNMKVKFREGFRPFAPAVLAERASDWFTLPVASPYMLLVASVAEQRRLKEAHADAEGFARLAVKRSVIPAVTHVDGSARIQTVHSETNPRFHALISRFDALTGCPVLVNTSFNVRGEPIVCTPEEAFQCFMATDMDMLVVENYVLDKASQDPSLRTDYASRIAPD